VIAGTSAGAMAMSSTMIYEGNATRAHLKGEVKITTGLGFMDQVIFDSHFEKRGRFARLAQAVSANPSCIGIGLGEDTGLLITGGNMMEAIGSGLIILVDGRNIVATNIYDVEMGSPVSIDNLKVHVMSIFDIYDLSQHRLIIKKTVKVEEGVFIQAPDSDLLQ
jgi:cyanophycinase